MLLAHNLNLLDTFRIPTASDPLRILISGCLAGLPCGIDGTDYGMGTVLRELLSLPTVRSFPFCPEDFAIGTPRNMPDIHGGDGFTVLRRQARVLDEHNVDLTDKMILGAEAMLAHAQTHKIELALLTDMSAACGSQVISDGCRLVEHRHHQVGVGVATALLLENGFLVVSQRDHRTLGHIRQLLDPTAGLDANAKDHHQSDWVVANLKNGSTRRR